MPPPDPAIELVVASQGMSKGLRQTEGPQLLGRAELALGPVVLGGYYKNVSSATADGEAGFSLQLRGRAGGFDLAASVAYKLNTGASLQPDRDAIEFFASVSHRFGQLQPRLSLTYSPDELGGTRETLYVEGGVSMSVAPGALLSANLARRERSGGPDYTAFNAGASYAVAPFLTLDLRYYDTAQGALGAVYRQRLVASLRARF
jgi:hypothetical protein